MRLSKECSGAIRVPVQTLILAAFKNAVAILLVALLFPSYFPIIIFALVSVGPKKKEKKLLYRQRGSDSRSFLQSFSQPLIDVHWLLLLPKKNFFGWAFYRMVIMLHFAPAPIFLKNFSGNLFSKMRNHSWVKLVGCIFRSTKSDRFDLPRINLSNLCE